MKSLLAPVTQWLTRLSEYLITFGAFGLFIVALLDSTFVPLPSSVDALMLLLSATYPSWMLLYAFMATSGSALGCLILYLISRRAGARALNRFSEKKQARVKNLIERYDMMAVLVATLLPPPFPFKLFVVSAGVFRFSLVRFMLAIVVGRGFRFLLEGYFAVRYGAEAKEILAKYYPWIGLALVAWILLFVFLKQKSLFTRGNPLGTENSSRPRDL
ncbi:MAG TPA: VTT domain-containing protein [Pyrinomonadaceae bacterium]|nr:VTT domain-containing protein [Pyrinomonadaceae bacterium]